MPARNPIVLGATLIVAGMVLLGFTDNFVQVIAREITVWQFHLLRSLMALPLLAAVALGAGMQVRPVRAGRVAVRSAVQAAGMFFYFASLPLMPIAQAGAGLFTAPLFVLIFAAALFRQPIGPARMLAVAIGFAGVLVMLRPDPANLSLVTMMPVAAGALYGLSNLLTREWCAEEPVGAMLAGFFLALGVAGGVVCLGLALHPAPVPVVAAAPFLTGPWAVPSAAALLATAVQAVGSLAGVGLITRGYQQAATSVLAVFEYSFLITATLWAWVLWGQALEPSGYLGIALIIASGALMACASLPGRAAGNAAQAAFSTGAKRP